LGQAKLTAITEATAIGLGAYTVPEAARLLKIRPLNIRRWLGGYNFNHEGDQRQMPPLWTPQLPAYDDHLEIGFRDLVELKFVREFLKAGLSLGVVRFYLKEAKKVINDDRPFSTRRFKTDGKTIFLEGIRDSGETELLDLKRKQYILKSTIDQSFKDLDIEDDAVTSWRPFNGKESIVIDPLRSFGQPIANDFGVPTTTLAQAVEAEGTVERVARLYEVPARIVRDAVAFERSLLAA
jgi:uncharacterized protein (DUF433 family)